jgi:Domain of unknown function (DUF4290)
MTHDMQYNSQLPHLIIPEYGRNVQQLIEHAKGIENRDARRAFIEKIVDLIQQLYPQSRNIDDYRDKIWRHILHIAKYELDLTLPNGEIARPEDAVKRPDIVPYPSIQLSFRHYGTNVKQLIAKALKMEEGSKRNEFVDVIGAYMKLAYRTWNKEHFVSDEAIKTDLALLSEGKLRMDEETAIENISQSNLRRSNTGSSSGGSNRSGGSSTNGRRDDSRNTRGGNDRGGSTNFRRDDRNGNSSPRRDDRNSSNNRNNNFNNNRKNNR